MDKIKLAKKWNPPLNDPNVSDFVKKRVGELLEMDLDQFEQHIKEKCAEIVLNEHYRYNTGWDDVVKEIAKAIREE